MEYFVQALEHLRAESARLNDEFNQAVDERRKAENRESEVRDRCVLVERLADELAAYLAGERRPEVPL